jgi:hypothetical protein
VVGSRYNGGSFLWSFHLSSEGDEEPMSPSLSVWGVIVMLVGGVLEAMMRVVVMLAGWVVFEVVARAVVTLADSVVLVGLLVVKPGVKLFWWGGSSGDIVTI